MPPRLRFRSSGSKLESKFALYWNSLGGPSLEREYRFDPSRRWRADFAHEPSRTLIEIEGGIWIQGRHNRAAGFVADMDKYLEATLAGWTVVRLTDVHLTTPILERLVKFVRGRCAQTAPDTPQPTLSRGRA